MNTLHDGFEWKEDTQAVFEKAVRNGVLSPATPDQGFHSPFIS